MPVTSSGVIEDIADVPGTVEEVFDRIAMFSNTEKWDPGCKSSVKVGNEPLGVGTTFDLVTVFKGSESKMV